jgi:transposase
MATKTDGPDEVEVGPDEVEVIDLPRPGKKRRFTAPEKKRLLEEAQAPGASVSSVARRYGISPSLLFRWRRLNDEGGLQGLGAEEAVVPESEVKQLKAQLREAQRLLGKKTMEVEILKEAIDLSRSKKLFLRSSSSEPGDGE